MFFITVRNTLKNYRNRRIINKEGGTKTSLLARKLAERNGVVVGLHTYGSCFDDAFNLGGQVQIGRYCSFGPNVRYFGANHPYRYACMSPYFYRADWWEEEYNIKDVPRKELIIGNDVWIGYGTIITSSCGKIGNGAVIGAGSIVTKDIPAYAIAMGSPAKVHGYRFPEDIQKKLEESKWWELEPIELIDYYDVIDIPEEWADRVRRSRHKSHEGIDVRGKVG